MEELTMVVTGRSGDAPLESSTEQVAYPHKYHQHPGSPSHTSNVLSLKIYSWYPEGSG